MSKDIMELRENYLALQVFVSAGRKIGHGSRILYVEECDGLWIKGYTGDGQACRIQVSSVKIEDVLSSKGIGVDWSIKGCMLKVEGNDVCPWGKKCKSVENNEKDDLLVFGDY